MKRSYLVVMAICLILLLVLSGCCPNNGKAATVKTSQTCTASPRTVKAAFEGGEAIVAFNDNPMTAELLGRTPISLQFHDQGGVMKVTTFSRDLFKAETATGMTPTIGDVALNVQTGEVIVYCRDAAFSPNLVLIGHVVSGLDKLFATTGSFEVYLIGS